MEDAEEIMELFDSCWFGSKKEEELPTTAMLMLHKIDDNYKLQLGSSSECSTRVDHKINTSVSKKFRRSLSIQEVKGFKDLGFVFDDNDPAIIPGLGKIECDDDDEKINFNCRVLYEIEKKGLKNWRMPASTKNKDNMKKHLRFWAHIVASNAK